MGPDDWLVDLLTQFGDRGLVAMVKMDGERHRGRWTVLVSGRPLGEREYVRWEGDDLHAGLLQVMTTLQERVPGLLN